MEFGSIEDRIYPAALLSVQSPQRKHGWSHSQTVTFTHAKSTSRSASTTLRRSPEPPGRIATSEIKPAFPPQSWNLLPNPPTIQKILRIFPNCESLVTLPRSSPPRRICKVRFYAMRVGRLPGIYSSWKEVRVYVMRVVCYVMIISSPVFI